MDATFRAAFAPLAALGSFDAQSLARTRISGADPILPTPYRIGAAATAALAAVGLVAERIWRERGGGEQNLAIDTRHAVASLRGNRYLRIDGKVPEDHRDVLSGLYPTADGWVYLHCNFPHHREGHLALLGAPADRESVAAKVREWKADALEEAMIAAGLPGGRVRTPDGWSSQEQARAVARLPLLEIARVGNAPPKPMPKAARPLAGVRVLDLTRVLAGPTCARTLAEHGADVLKINSPRLPNSGVLEFDTGLGKRSAFLDLTDARARDQLRDLARSADVFCQSYRPGALDAKGFSFDALAAARPGLVYVSLSAFGHTGPWAARRGFDTVVTSVSGMAHCQGTPDRPQTMPVSALDYTTGYLLAFGAMRALERRAVEGGSWLVRTSLAQVAHWIASLGLVERSKWRDLAPEFPPGDIARWSVDTLAPQGAMRNLAPAIKLDRTPAHWARPSVPLGSDPPAWW